MLGPGRWGGWTGVCGGLGCAARFTCCCCCCCFAASRAAFTGAAAFCALLTCCTCCGCCCAAACCPAAAPGAAGFAWPAKDFLKLSAHVLASFHAFICCSLRRFSVAISCSFRGLPASAL